MAERQHQEQPPPGLQLRRTLSGIGARFKRVAWSPDGRLLAASAEDGQQLASASSDTRILIWDAATGAVLRKLQRHSLTVSSVAWSPDGEWLASSSTDTSICIWHAGAGCLVRSLEGHTDSVTQVS